MSCFSLASRWLGLSLLAAMPLPAALAPNAVAPVPPGVELRAAAVRVQVSPDHRDWTYRVGEPARFRVSVIADQVPLDGVSATYTVGQEMMDNPSREIVIPADGVTIDGGTLQQPGFIRCAVTVKFGKRTYRGFGTAAFSPEKIQPTQTNPADFDAFWAEGKAELAEMPIDARVTLLPDQCTSSANVYHVSFRNAGKSWDGSSARVYGILCEPKAPGKYPALLRVPGAGIRPYRGDRGYAERGVITLEIGIHGIPVNLPQEVYDALGTGALNGYESYNLDDRKKYYYRRVVLGCLRANDFLTSRENWDGKTLVVAGASQGGLLSLATAALDPRVTALAATHPAYSDVTGYLHGRAGGWPHMFKPDSKTGAPSSHAIPSKIATTGYYDTVSFARRVKVPGFYNWGYNDEVCPPTSMYAAYNVISAPKKLALTLELGHQYTQEQSDIVDAWLSQQFGIKPNGG